jgi:hypothetical protein
MGRFIAGFLCGNLFTVLIGLCVVFFVFLRDLPTLQCSVSVPAQVSVGDTVSMVVAATNAHSGAIVLDSIDVDESFLEGFRVERVQPNPTETMSVFGMRTWSFGKEVGIGETVEVHFTLKAVVAGHFSGDIDVCNPNQNFSTAVADVVVESP